MTVNQHVEISPRSSGGFIVDTYNNGLYVGGPVDSVAEALAFIRRHCMKEGLVVVSCTPLINKDVIFNRQQTLAGASF